MGEWEVERQVAAVLPVAHLAQEVGAAAAAALGVAFGRERQFPLLHLPRQTTGMRTSRVCRAPTTLKSRDVLVS